MFIAACEGYFDKEENEMLISRKIAQCMWMGKPEDFERFWPLPKNKVTNVVKKIWGSAEEANEFRKRIEEAHGIKLR